MKNYITHLTIPSEVKEALLNEFFDSVHKAKIYTASNGVITRSLDEMEVIRNEDVVDCPLANQIAKNLERIIVHEVRPRYYRQAGGSDLESHRDVGATVALNTVLSGSGPICFEDKYDVMYECALIDVTQIHSVKTPDDRILFRLTMNDIDYAEVLEFIDGREQEIFDI